ncbi:MAG: TonB-dependent receptor [Bacteroidetes bacterium]|nr:TonB-dependent receptor [Bacteroidota bacterium]
MRFIALAGIVFFQILFSTLYGQKISGIVKDSASGRSLGNVEIRAFHPRDSANFISANADSSGKFSFALTKGFYRIRFSLEGYTTVFRIARVDNVDIDLDIILLNDLATGTKEAKISVASPVRQIGDTTEFNAGSFKVNPDATAEDLVKKLPGITVENGAVKAQGEEVKKVTLDGKDFFGDDAQTALKNLPADIVDKIQVFERMSDQAQFTGFDDGQGVKSLNIKTKRGKANGTFGKAYAGYGTEKRYQSGVNYNKFNGNRRITVLGMSNNINIQNFTSQDLIGVSSGNSSRSMGGPGGPGGNSGSGSFLVGNNNGITGTNALGLNYNDKWGTKITVSGSYFFNRNVNTQNQNILRTYNNSFSGSQQFYADSSIAENSSYNHRFNARVEYAPDTNNSFIYIPSISFQNSDNAQIDFIRNYSPSFILNQSKIDYLLLGNGMNFSNNIMFRHKFEKRGRTFSISADNQINSKATNTTNQSSNRSYIPMDSTFATDQYVESNSPQKSIGSRISYTEPIGKTGMLQFDYRINSTKTDNQKYTNNFNSSENKYSNFDTSLSNKYHVNYISHQPGFMYRVRGKKLNLGAGIGYQWSSLNGTQVFPVNSEVHKTFNNVLPRVFMNYKWNKTTNMRGMFRSSTNIPSITQLQNVINTSNAQLLTIGNPELKQEVTQNFNLNFAKSNTEKLTNIFIGFFGNQTSNYITNSTSFLQRDSQISDGFMAVQGSQISKPVNLNGYWSGRIFGVYGFPVKKIKSNLNLNSTLSYSEKPGMVNEIRNLSKTAGISGGVSINSNISENLDYSISYTTNYYNTVNSTQNSLNNSYFNHNAMAKFNYIYKSHFVWNTEAVYNNYKGLSSNYDQEFVLWNAGLGYKFLKNNAAEFRLSCYDILKQNKSINRTINETYIEDNFTKVLTRYFMLTFTYNFKKFANGGAEPKADEHSGHMGPLPGGPPPGGKAPY